jgi:WD40 repeat protein
MSSSSSSRWHLVAAFFGVLLVQLACITSAPPELATGSVATILALTQTPGSQLPTNTVPATITRTSTPTVESTLDLFALITPTPPPAGGAVSIYATPIAMASTSLPTPNQMINATNSAYLVEYLRLGSGRNPQIYFSSDGSWLGIATSAGRDLFDASTLSLASPEVHTWEVIFSPGEKDLRAVQIGGDVYVEEVKDGKLIENLIGAKNENIHFSADWSLAIGALGPNYFGVWDVSTGELYRKLDLSSVPEELKCPTLGIPDISADGSLIAAGCLEKDIAYIWRIEDAVLLHILQGDTGVAAVVRFSPNNRILATLHAQNEVHLWRTRDGELLQVFKGSPGPWQLIHGDLDFSHDGYYLVAAFENGQVAAWRTVDGELLRRFSEVSYFSANQREGLKITADGSMLVYPSWDRLFIRELLTSQLKFTVDSGNTSGRRISDTDQQQQSLSGAFSGYILDYDLASDNKKMAVVFDDGDSAVYIYRLDDGDLELRLELDSPPHLVRFSPDAAYLAICLPAGIEIYQTNPWEKINEIPFQMGFELIDQMIFSPDGKFLVFSKNEKGFEVWNFGNGQKHVDIAYIGIGDMAFSPGGTFFAAGDGEKVTLWDVSDWTVSGEVGAVGSALAFSPDGALLAADAQDGKVRFFNTDTLAFSGVLASNFFPAHDMRFTTTGRWFITGSYDGTVSYWGISP